MRARISDPEVFQGLSHIDVRAYLAAQGWKESDRIGNKALVFIKKDSDGKDWEILLPTRSDLGDYAQRMAEALHYVALLEHRSELAVLNDLQLSGFDVVRVRISHAEEVGTISVVVGVGLLRHARNMLLASACAAIMPRPVYHARRPDKASQYLASVRLGQTERGSYVVPLLSTVGPALRLQARQPKLDLNTRTNRLSDR